MASPIEWAQALQDTAFAVQLAESRYEFPLLEGFHLVGLGLSVGLIALIDLRLAGLFLRQVPANDVLHQLRPWVLLGFALTFVSGSLLFCSEAVTVLQSPAFPFKMFFIFLAGSNALWFEIRIARDRQLLTAGGTTARMAGTAGFASLALWTLVVASGRLIPYLTSW